MQEAEAEDPTASLHKGDESWHDGPGWYYVDDDYPDEGSCGAFATAEEARSHAEACGYDVVEGICSLAARRIRRVGCSP